MLQQLKLKYEKSTLYKKIKVTILLFSIIPISCLLVISIPIIYKIEQNKIQKTVKEETNSRMSDMDYIMNTIELLARSVRSDTYLTSEINKAIIENRMREYERYVFKNQTLSVLKVMLSINPIKAVRIHVDYPEIREYPPYLYHMDYAKESSWYEYRNEIPMNGKWYLDVTGRKKQESYSGYFSTSNMASFVVPMKISNKINAVFEVVVQLEDIMPDLYKQMIEEDTILIDQNYNLYEVNQQSFLGNITLEDLEKILHIETFENYEGEGLEIYNCWLDYKPVVVVITDIRGTGAFLVRIISTSKQYLLFLIELSGLLAGGVIVIYLILHAINKIVQRLLGDFSIFIKCVTEVGKGKLDIQIPKLKQVEVNEVALAYNQMLLNIRSLTEEAIHREVMVKDAQLKALEKQIDAHFLYNTLESIKMMAEMKGVYDVADAVLALGKMFRYNLEINNHDVMLWEEIAYLDNYLKISNIRYDYYINLSKKIEESVREVKVPKIILQPIVENSVKYGLDELAEDTTIYLKIYIKDDDIYIEVTDMGKGMSEEQLEDVRRNIVEHRPKDFRHKGIGLSNIHERIQLMYGKRYGVQIYSKENSYTKVVLVIGRGENTYAEDTNC